jgi:hypothetical protein
MCPFCLATLGYVVAGAVSTGGLTALALKMSRPNNSDNETNSDVRERRSQDVNRDDYNSENRLA